MNSKRYTMTTDRQIQCNVQFYFGL